MKKQFRHWFISLVAILVFIFFSCLPAQCQSTTVSATVVDSAGVTWANGTWAIDFVPSPGSNVAYRNGILLTPGSLHFAGSLSSVGFFTTSVPSSSSITPSGSSYNVKVCPNATTNCTIIQGLTFSGTSIDISSTITANTPAPVVNALPVARAYNDTEVAVSPSQAGYFYLNVTNNQPRYWNGAIWQAFAAGLAGISSGNASPLFTTSITTTASTATVNYTLSTAAANTIFGNCTGSSALPVYCTLTNAMLPTTLTANTTGTAANITGIVAPANGGTGTAIPNLITGIITNIDGQVDESIVNLGGTAATVTADNTNYQPGRVSGAGIQGGWNIALAAAGTTQEGLILNPVMPIPPVAAIGAWIYIPSASLANISSIVLTTQMQSTHYINCTRSSTTTPALVAGWNLIRCNSYTASTLAANESVQYPYVQMTTTAAANITIGQLWLEAPPKAQIVITADGPFVNYFLIPSGNQCGGSCSGTSPGGISFVGGYPDLLALSKSIGIPIPIVLDVVPTALGANNYASWAQIASIVAANPTIEINPFCYDLNSEVSMTAAQMLQEILPTIKAVEAQGYTVSPYKSIFLNGQAANTSVLQPYFLGLGTSTQNYGVPFGAWPPSYQWDIPRYSLANVTTTSQMHAQFTSTTAPSLLTMHGFYNIGLHGVNTSGEVLPAVWGQFLDELKNCLTGGWCEVMTFAQLAARDGVQYKRGPTGGTYITYTDQNGVAQIKVQP